MTAVSKKEAWIWALRPKTLAVATVSVSIGSALGYYKAEHFSLILFLSMLLSSIALQAASNLINDAADEDTDERIGFPRATQMGWLTPKAVMRGGFIAMLLAFFFAGPLFYARGVWLVPLFALSALSSWAYTAGPYPLKHRGLGELFVMVFFGLVITSLADYIQSGSFTLLTLLASVQAGAMPVAILAINNLRDIYQDKKVGKRTVAVRYGISFAKQEIAFFALLPFLLSPLWGAVGAWTAALFPLALLPLTFTLLQGIFRHEPGAIYNSYFGLAALIHLLFGALLSLSLLYG